MTRTHIEVGSQKNYRGENIRYLIQEDKIMMSSDDIELREVERVAKSANGRCLILGLGLGLLPVEIDRRGGATSIFIVEHDMEVIKLFFNETLENYYKEFTTPMTIHHGDVNSWKPLPLMQFDWVYADWWMEPTYKAYEEYNAFKEKIVPHLSRNASVRCWGQKKFEQEDFWVE